MGWKHLHIVFKTTFLFLWHVWYWPVDGPGRDGEEGGEEEPRPQDVDSLGELLDHEAPDQAHHAEQDDDDLVELLRPALAHKVHVDGDVLDRVNHDDGVFCLESVNKYINIHALFDHMVTMNHRSVKIRYREPSPITNVSKI